MRNVLPAACAAVLVTLAASACFAGDGRYYDNYGGYNYDDNGYYNEGYGNNPGYDYGYGGGYQYRQDVVSPRSIVWNLRHDGFSDISRPVLAGRFYQLKARDPNGHRVKLYIDAFNGRIAKVKS